MYPWKTVIALNKDLKRPLYLQFADQVVKEINNGRIKPGLKLPGTRQLSIILEINRKTVIQAIDKLVAQGWLEAVPSKGTFVPRQLPLSKTKPLDQDAFNGNPINTDSDYTYIEDQPQASHHILQVDGGCPDTRLAPIDWFYKESKAAIKMRNGFKLLKYADARGSQKLREVMVDYLAESRGMDISIAHIMITRGSQMGIFLTMNLLLGRSKCAAMGDSSYDAADWVVLFNDSKILRIPVDAQGLDANHLENICLQRKVHVVYITPHHHFPTTVTLSSERRLKLLDLAEKYNFYIIEDDYDFDFHYKSGPVLPLASLNRHRVIYIGSFSKIFAPGIRVGYLVAQPSIIEQLSKISRIIDRQGDQVLQQVIAEAITSGELNRHLKKSIKLYRQRRDYLAVQLREKLGNHVTFDLPEGGMAIWLKLIDVKLSDLKPHLEENGLSIDINTDLARDYNAFRFGFASLTFEEIDDAVKILSKVIYEVKRPSS
ncbi:PLP-dependent aminotransferase family protein [Fulvivirga sp. RKSG066]|uniref:MocR-like pyridoxine biosynthesis transcription factor PdxR n=1 Tax=Fulvivirga aurantia TaxID=2529383 RepID=UPI0012BC0427|nr:PLP-dependent aminotransferase family protein [Fulvivirga aurantia]MTI21831.1 PLP-dependent aminotransferase family protein [Fulvivirga aurantia]